MQPPSMKKAAGCNAGGFPGAEDEILKLSAWHAGAMVTQTVMLAAIVVEDRAEAGDDYRNHQYDGSETHHPSPLIATIPAVKVSTNARANCPSLRTVDTVHPVVPYQLATPPINAAAAMVWQKRPNCCR